MDKIIRRTIETGEPREGLELDLAYEKAVAALQKDATNPRDQKFLKVYGESAIEEDLEYVREKERTFAREETVEEHGAKRVGTIFEGLIHEQSEQNDWLGPDAHTIKTALFDDIKHGVDIIVEFQKRAGEASHLALAVDVTFSRHAESKLKRLVGRLERGALTEVKYFSSEYLHITGTLEDVPEVVIGASRETVRGILPLWLGRKNKELSEHKMQFLILEEMRLQLQTLEAYARFLAAREQDLTKKEKYIIIAERYKTALQIVFEVIKNKAELKKKLGISLKDLERDPVFKSISEYMVGLARSFSD